MDERLSAILSSYEGKKEEVIPILQKVQGEFGFLPEQEMFDVARFTRVPECQVYGVATFYHFFTLKPKGEHTCVVCLGTACYVKGADKVQAAVENATGIKAGETTEDNKVSLLTARCIGACGVAPAVTYDGAVSAKQTPQDALAKIKEWTGHDAE
jgi:bidirectional [NiFe] hydrogenase diaphorase subunit